MPEELSFAPAFGDRTSSIVNMKKPAIASERPSIASTQRASILSKSSLCSFAKENFSSFSGGKPPTKAMTSEDLAVAEINRKRELKQRLKMQRQNYYAKVATGTVASKLSYIAAPATEMVPFKLQTENLMRTSSAKLEELLSAE